MLFAYVSLLVLLLAPPALASTSTVLGSTEAQRCYEESRLVLSMAGIQHCNSAIQDGNLTRRDLAATYSNRGLILAGNGDLDLALKDQDRAIKILPTLAQAYINRGNVYHHMRRYEEALADYRRAVALESGPRSIPHYNSGLTLLRMKRNEEALAEFKLALEFDPDSRKIIEKIQFIEGLDEEKTEGSQES